MSNNHNPYAHLDARQLDLATDLEMQASNSGTDRRDLLNATQLDNADKAALAQAWADQDATVEYQTDDSDELPARPQPTHTHTDTFEALARRCERGAEALEHEADHAAEILPTRAGGDQADPQQWAARKRDAARAAREYAAGLRAEAGDRGPSARMNPAQLAEADRVATAAELGGILIDGRPLAEQKAQSDSYFDQYERGLWETGRHPTQDKAREIEATGKFEHVAETIDGVEQVPFWQLGRAGDENAPQHTDRRADEDEA